MKKMFLLVMILAAAGCSKDISVEATVTSHDGANGHSVVSVYQEASPCECANSGSRLDMYLDMDDSLSVTDSDIYLNSLIVCNGLNGLNGTNGTNGLDGLNGTDGTNGTNGIDGINGTNGATGPQGIPGEQGPQGLQGLVGPQGIAGTNGSNGLPGPTGPVGPTGPQGIQGPAGSPGSSASITSYSAGSCVAIAGTSDYVKVSNSNFDLYTTSNCSGSSKIAELSQGESYWVSSNSLAVWSSGSLRVITFN